MKINKIGIIGLGYVGLPLAVEFGRKYKTVGYDINSERVKLLKKGHDSTLEVEDDDLKSILINDIDSFSVGFKPSNDLSELKNCDIYIITVPTPVDKSNKPDFHPLKSASKLVGKILSKNNIVVYESTVYPGATEEICIPILEENSKLEFNKDFYVGYSPERINPGDKNRTLTKILKITSGSNKYSALIIDKLYNSIIDAGTYLAPSIKIAEAAKVIENSQRDINIAFVNELAKIFNLLNIDTNEVLKAAGTKWNFLNFKPGLVGGHCIGVDPFYLADIAINKGYEPEIILSGRYLNDSMSKYVAEQIDSLIKKSDTNIDNLDILVLGVTFKENCPDFRNTKVIDMVNYLIKLRYSVDVYDPWVDSDKFKSTYNFEVFNSMPSKKYKLVVHAVSHKVFEQINYRQLKNQGTLIYDVKGKINNFSDQSL